MLNLTSTPEVSTCWSQTDLRVYIFCIFTFQCGLLAQLYYTGKSSKLQMRHEIPSNQTSHYTTVFFFQFSVMRVCLCVRVCV